MALLGLLVFLIFSIHFSSSQVVLTNLLTLNLAGQCSDSMMVPTSMNSMIKGLQLCDVVQQAFFYNNLSTTGVTCGLLGFSTANQGYSAQLRIAYTSTSPPALTASQLYASCVSLGGSNGYNCSGAYVTGIVLLSATVGVYPDCDNPADNDCSAYATCINTATAFTCQCRPTFRDDSPAGRPGRICTEICSPTLCSNQGNCTETRGLVAYCRCNQNHAGYNCGVSAASLAGDFWTLITFLIVLGSVCIVLVVAMLTLIIIRRVGDYRAEQRTKREKEESQREQMKSVINKTLIPVKRKYKKAEGKEGEVKHTSSFAQFFHNLSHLRLNRKSSKSSLEGENAGTGQVTSRSKFEAAHHRHGQGTSGEIRKSFSQPQFSLASGEGSNVGAGSRATADSSKSPLSFSIGGASAGLYATKNTQRSGSSMNLAVGGAGTDADIVPEEAPIMIVAKPREGGAKLRLSGGDHAAAEGMPSSSSTYEMVSISKAPHTSAEAKTDSSM